MVLVSSAVFAISSGVLSAGRFRARAASAERRDLEVRLLEVGGLEANLEKRAKRLSRKLGMRDAWDASAKVSRAGGDETAAAA